jgi:mannose-6-phosphate isomerase
MNQERYLAYPLKFRPIFKEKIWGGQHLKGLYKRPILPKKKIGESWEVSCLDQDVSVVSNGPYEGKRLSELVDTFSEAVLGTEVFERFAKRFPLLFKLIDAAGPISVQVHPSDDDMVESSGWGKTEMWHILWAAPEAKVFCGLKDWIREDNLPSFIANNQLRECMEAIPVAAGDTVYIPAGRVHGTEGAMVLLEIQQNSDITYRLYDWDRVGPGNARRALQVDEALEVIRYHDDEERIVNPIVSKKDEVEERLLVTCDYFTVEKIKVPIFFSDRFEGDRFGVYFIASGRGELYPRGMQDEAMVFDKGDFLFLPASVGSIEVQTDTSCEIIKTIVT